MMTMLANMGPWGDILLIMAASTLAVVLLLRIIDRIWKLDARRVHNDIAGFMISVIAVVYAVLLGFVTVTVWENYEKAETAVDTEVNLLADIYRDSANLPRDSAVAIRRNLIAYITSVIEREWPAQRRGRCHGRRSQLDTIASHLHSPATADVTATAFIGETISRLNQLYDARRARLAACSRSVPTLIWSAAIIGSLCIVGFSLCFGVANLRVHMIMSAVLTGSVATVLWVIFELSTPFQGAAAISHDVYREARDVMVSSDVSPAHPPPDGR
jgi:hypothetical protein